MDSETLFVAVRGSETVERLTGDVLSMVIAADPVKYRNAEYLTETEVLRAILKDGCTAKAYAPFKPMR